MESRSNAVRGLGSVFWSIFLGGSMVIKWVSILFAPLLAKSPILFLRRLDGLKAVEECPSATRKTHQNPSEHFAKGARAKV